MVRLENLARSSPGAYYSRRLAQASLVTSLSQFASEDRSPPGSAASKSSSSVDRVLRLPNELHALTLPQRSTSLSDYDSSDILPVHPQPLTPSQPHPRLLTRTCFQAFCFRSTPRSCLIFSHSIYDWITQLRLVISASRSCFS